MDCRRIEDSRKETPCGARKILLVKSESNSEHVGTKNDVMESENNPKAGTDKTCRVILVTRDSRRTVGPGGIERGRPKAYETSAPAVPPNHENLSHDQSSGTSDSSSSSSSTSSTSSEWNSAGEHSSSSSSSSSRTSSSSSSSSTSTSTSSSRSQQHQKSMPAEVLVTPTPTVLPTVTPEPQIKSNSPTKRAAEPTTLDVPPLAKHLRQRRTDGCPEHDSRKSHDSWNWGRRPSVILAWSRRRRRIARPLVDGAEADETIKAQQEEVDRIVEFEVSRSCGNSCWERSELRPAGSWTTRRTESEHDSSRGNARATK